MPGQLSASNGGIHRLIRQNPSAGAAEGASAALVYLHDALAASIDEQGGNALALEADVTSRQQAAATGGHR
jgi:hypothetical protein